MATIQTSQYLQVRIVSPKTIVFQGKAISVSARNSAGKFDILPFHANFVSFIDNNPITIILPDQSTKTFNFPFAIISNNNNKVDIYTEIPHQSIS